MVNTVVGFFPTRCAAIRQPSLSTMRYQSWAQLATRWSTGAEKTDCGKRFVFFQKFYLRIETRWTRATEWDRQNEKNLRFQCILCMCECVCFFFVRPLFGSYGSFFHSSILRVVTVWLCVRRVHFRWFCYLLMLFVALWQWYCGRCCRRIYSTYFFSLSKRVFSVFFTSSMDRMIEVTGVLIYTQIRIRRCLFRSVFVFHFLR